jgi:drug/metabolite transporter (DMT)-like permease
MAGIGGGEAAQGLTAETAHRPSGEHSWKFPGIITKSGYDAGPAMTVSLGALLIVLASSICWAGVDTSRKLLAGRVRAVPLIVLLTLASVPPFGAWLAWEGVPEVGPGYWVPALASLVLNVFSNLAFIHALRVSPLSVAVPLLSLTPVFAALAGIPLLGERPAPAQFLGILLVVAGAFVLHWPGRGRIERGALWVVAVAFSWSLTIPLDKLAVESSSAPFHASALCFGVGLVVLAILTAQGRLRELADIGRARGAFALCLGGSVLALALQFIAFQLVWVSLIETIKRGVGNLSALLMGRLLFGEPVTPRKVLALGLMVVGVALVVR